MIDARRHDILPLGASGYQSSSCAVFGSHARMFPSNAGGASSDTEVCCRQPVPIDEDLGPSPCYVQSTTFRLTIGGLPKLVATSSSDVYTSHNIFRLCSTVEKGRSEVLSGSRSCSSARIAAPKSSTGKFVSAARGPSDEPVIHYWTISIKYSLLLIIKGAISFKAVPIELLYLRHHRLEERGSS
jgi:hypothetical protein